MLGTPVEPAVEVRLLGPVEAYREGRAVRLGGRRQRTVLAALAVEPGLPVSADRLIDVVWGDEAPDGARRSLQVHVSSLRGLLDPGRVGVIGGDETGYRLASPPTVVTDVQRFEALAEQSQPGPLRAALDLWRGPPLGGVDDGRLTHFVVGWTERYLAAAEAWAAVSAAAGQPQLPLPELERLLAEHPLRESLWGAVISCLVAAGRSAQARAAYERVKNLLADQGMAPSPALRALEDGILVEDAAVAATKSGGAPLPEGVVTFVILDIEGSTRLLRRLGDGYAHLLESYRQAIEAEVARWRGHVVSYEGDGAFLAFESPDDAVGSALAVLQRAAGMVLADGGRLRVRAGIHSGLASPRGGDYVAVAVHQTSRVAGTARGGQLVVSDATVSLLSADHRLRPIGRFRLRDFDGPVLLHMAAVDQETFERPIRALSADRHNLARRLTPTIGREAEVDSVSELLGSRALVTLVGPGGVGKTRLADEVALRVAELRVDGAWKVSLAAVEDPEQVGSALASGLGIPASGDPDLDNAIEYLADRSCVVYLDNCEHLIWAVRDLVALVLARCPGVAVLTTSREPLLVEGETVVRVAPLDLPESDQTEAVATSSAVRLFESRASAASGSFALDDVTSPAVAELCRLLDGLPLLIELAAAQVAYLSPAEILGGVVESLDTLAARGPAAEPRHQTAEAVLEWGYRLLSAPLQEAFRRLSVFGLSFTVDMAAAALGQGAATLIWDLLDRSLLIDDRGAGETRYRMLRTVRLHGRVLAEASGDMAPTARRIADHLLGVVGPWLPVDARWVSAVDQEQENLRALVKQLAETDQETAQQVACVLARHHNAAQTFADGIDEATRLAGRLPEPTPSRVALLAAQADLRLRTGDLEGAGRCVEAAQTLADLVGAPSWDDVAVDRALAELATRSGRVEDSIRIARERLSRPVSARGRSRMLNALGIALAGTGDLERAYEAFEEELAASEEAGAEPWIPSAHGNLAEIAFQLGDLRTAAGHQATCLQLGLEEGLPAMVAFSLMLAARFAGDGEAWEAAARLQCCADRMLEEIGLALFADDEAAAEELRARCRAHLGDAGYRTIADGAARCDVSAVSAEARDILEMAAT